MTTIWLQGGGMGPGGGWGSGKSTPRPGTQEQAKSTSRWRNRLIFQGAASNYLDFMFEDF